MVLSPVVIIRLAASGLSYFLTAAAWVVGMGKSWRVFVWDCIPRGRQMKNVWVGRRSCWATKTPGLCSKELLLKSSICALVVFVCIYHRPPVSANMTQEAHRTGENEICDEIFTTLHWMIIPHAARLYACNVTIAVGVLQWYDEAGWRNLQSVRCIHRCRKGMQGQLNFWRLFRSKTNEKLHDGIDVYIEQLFCQRWFH